MGLAMATLPRRQYIAHAIALVAANCLVQSLMVPLDNWRATVDLVWIAQPILQATLFGDALLMIAASRDKVSRPRTQAQLTALQTRERTQQVETSRLLHDHVLHALYGLGRQSSSSTPAAIVEDCRVAIDALSARRSQDHLRRLEDLLSADLPVSVEGGSSVPLPPPGGRRPGRRSAQRHPVTGPASPDHHPSRDGLAPRWWRLRGRRQPREPVLAPGAGRRPGPGAPRPGGRGTGPRGHQPGAGVAPPSVQCAGHRLARQPGRPHPTGAVAHRVAGPGHCPVHRPAGRHPPRGDPNPAAAGPAVRGRWACCAWPPASTARCAWCRGRSAVCS